MWGLGVRVRRGPVLPLVGRLSLGSACCKAKAWPYSLVSSPRVSSRFTVSAVGSSQPRIEEREQIIDTTAMFRAEKVERLEESC
ncbi:Os02g0712550 [Oryza sativa Japonica Group]|uniref:Os02g0712550 protein n=2 Tax=Oryza sativa subsp. japonica TaxID=39947 RepID=C7IZ15_ORYSJ|nr:Os02g0712550 [Oryza sativa Japonica Group]BAS80578.1 Os02g0712550 [Oryza sativa Japonica Group]|eukprot:NP_001173135.1 Os02g0712550 [Oryza sativa Japonica Group]